MDGDTMITLHVETPYASFRKSYARSFGETYPLPPPATVYGMLLSLVGEQFRRRHEGVRLAFAYKRAPRIATTLRKLSRFKYGVPAKQSKLGNAPDFIETLCDIEFLCWVDSSQETQGINAQTLEGRITESIYSPSKVNRNGVLYLGLSDDAVNEVQLMDNIQGQWQRLFPSEAGHIELPIWVDHVGSINTRWQRYTLESEATLLKSEPGNSLWRWTDIISSDDQA
jgi:CRISPR-associated protein Cas5t